MKVWEQKQECMCRGGHKMNLFDCCLINLLHRCFINPLIFNVGNSKVAVNKGIVKENLIHRCFINGENLFDCCLIEKGKR